MKSDQSRKQRPTKYNIVQYRKQRNRWGIVLMASMPHTLTSNVQPSIT
ncbi:hypothetical protein PVAP13_4KG340188 [Panicum virgatum]|uniref:Uncharacterized protein n=1 Tax=Panicum virgatum TaxID=38727 RepID=A0A8T0TVQ0_PANVG|nr:hypothetical protein PVAP13_4KG340188 [Panicum virgatum]